MSDRNVFYSSWIAAIAGGIIVAISGCECKPDTSPRFTGSDGFDYKSTTIDGCEYLYSTTNGHDSLTHKGNCQTCFKRMELLFRCAKREKAEKEATP